MSVKSSGGVPAFPRENVNEISVRAPGKLNRKSQHEIENHDMKYNRDTKVHFVW